MPSFFCARPAVRGPMGGGETVSLYIGSVGREIDKEESARKNGGEVSIPCRFFCASQPPR